MASSSMTVQVAAQKRGEGRSAEDLYEAAEGFVPEIRRRALKMERARRLDDDLVEAMDAAGLFSVIVPKRWGGAGLRAFSAISTRTDLVFRFFRFFYGQFVEGAFS